MNVVVWALVFVTAFVMIDRLMARFYWPDKKSAVEDFRDGLRALRRAVEHRPATSGEIKKSHVRSDEGRTPVRGR